jgi:flagellar motor protein MotB
MLFGTSAYADTRPASSNDTENGKAANRRIDLRFIVAAQKEQDYNAIKFVE